MYYCHIVYDVGHTILHAMHLPGLATSSSEEFSGTLYEMSSVMMSPTLFALFFGVL